MAAITFHVSDSRTGAPLAGAGIHAESPWGPWNGLTNDLGDFHAELGAAHYQLTIAKAGYVTVQMPADLEYPGTVQIALSPSATPNIRLNGIDGFADYRYWLDGRNAELDELMAEAKDCGFNGRRVFMTGSKSQNNFLELSPFEPRWEEQLKPFAEYIAGKGLILLATLGVDYQIVCPKESDQQHFWQVAGQAFQGIGTMLSGRNEGDKNGVPYSTVFPAMPGVFCLQGSMTQDLIPPTPQLNGNEFHQRRNYPNRETDAVASAISLRDQGYNQPLFMTEAIPFAEGGDGSGQSSDAALAWRLGRLYATEWQGAVFHNRFSQFNALMGPTTRSCAVSWSQGMTI